MKLRYALSVISLFILLFNAQKSVSAEPLLPHGAYSNLWSDGEHWNGWEIFTWMQGAKLVGFVSLKEGLIGDEFYGEFENLKFNKLTGKLSFSAYFINVKIRVNFSGTLWPDYVVGSFILDNSNVLDVTLPRRYGNTSLFKRFESYEEMTIFYELQPNPSFKRDALNRAP